MIRIDQASFSYNDRPVLDRIDLRVEKGQMVALSGPNGSGKTTLIKLACGVLHPNKGEVYLDGANVSQMKRRQVAQQIAVVPQQFFTPFAFTVREVVLLGRTPFLKAFSDERQTDRQAVERAMDQVGIQDLKDRYFNEVSGGERQKAILAMALAQEPQALLLDEPTAHLDINHQVEILEMVRTLNRSHGLTVVGAIHDLNMAALYFDRAILLKDGRVFADGPPSEVLTEETIRDVFSASVHVSRHPLTGAPHIIVTPRDHPH